MADKAFDKLDLEFEKLHRDIVEEHAQMADNAESDARSILAKLAGPRDDPYEATYQLMLFHEHLKSKINLFSLVAIIEDFEKNKAIKNAAKKHAPHNKAKEFVIDEWRKHKDEYDNNKSAFARDYVAIVSNNFTNSKGDPLKITEKQLREVWLKDTLPASKQAG